MPAFVTAVANQKGGSGKTSLTIEVATALTLRAKARVLTIDADPQHGLLDWREDREAAPLFPVVGFASPKLSEEVRAHTPNYDHIIIDAPPRNTGILRAAAICSHAMLIPVQPSKHDIRGTREFVEMVQEALTFNPGLKAAFVINRRITGTALGRDIFSALEEFPFPTLHTVIDQRVAFTEAHGFGLSVMEYHPINPKAVSEVEELVVELLETLNHGEKDSTTHNKKAARVS